MKAPARFISAVVLGAAVALIVALTPATSTAAEEKAEKGPKNSPALAKPLKEANDDLKAK